MRRGSFAVVALASLSLLARGRQARADEPAPTVEPTVPAAGTDPMIAPTVEREARSTRADSPPRARQAAQKARVALWPTLTPAGDAPGSPLHRPGDADGDLAKRAQELDATLRDAAQDLGFSLAVGEVAPSTPRDVDVLARSAPRTTDGDAGAWVVSPRLEAVGSDAFLLRVVVASPAARELRVRIERVKGSEVAVRGLVMLRDMLASEEGASVRTTVPKPSETEVPPAPVRSAGRAVLAANGALLGAFLAFGVQRASVTDPKNAEDPRVLLPLLTLGTGVGLGSALLAAEEWDIGVADAWYLAAGTWWGAASGFFAASGTDVQPINDRYLWGSAGGLGGMALSVLALSRGPMTDGGALLTHSGGALGLGLGSAVELMVRGTFDRPPPLGQSIGSALGVAAMGLVATQTQPSSSRVLLLDLGVGLGALAGAAATSPLVFDPSPGRVRGFLAATVGGATAGGIAAALLTRSSRASSQSSWLRHGTPTLGALGGGVDGQPVTWGVGWRGSM